MSRTFADSLDYDAENIFFNVNEFARAYFLSRGVKTTSSVAAVTSVRIYERVDETGVVTEVEATDFDLPATAYLIDAVQRDPSPGDRFGDGSNVWEVMPIGRRKCFEPLDGDARVIRVHTRKVIRG